MTTITVSLSGSAIVNGSKSYVITDADLQSVLNWVKATYFAPFPGARGAGAPDPNPTNQQLLLRWVQLWIDGTKSGVQRLNTTQPVVPPPLNIT